MTQAFDRAMWPMLADNLATRADKIAAIDQGRRTSYAALAARPGASPTGCARAASSPATG